MIRPTIFSIWLDSSWRDRNIWQTAAKQNKQRRNGGVRRGKRARSPVRANSPASLRLLAYGGVMALMAPTSVTHWTTLYRNTLYAASTGDFEGNGPLLFWSTVEVMRWIVPILMAAMAVSVLSGLAQGGFNFAPEALALKFDRFNPASKLGQIFSPVGLSNLLNSLLPFGAILWIADQLRFARIGSRWCMPPVWD